MSLKSEDKKPMDMHLTLSEPEHYLTVLIGLVGGEDESDDTDVSVRVEGRGFPESAEGALEVAELLEAIVVGIRSRIPQSESRDASDERPHSRACGPRQHPHGKQCSPNCPTCSAEPAIAQQQQRPRFNPRPRFKSAGESGG